jgi:hypothetical protein
MQSHQPISGGGELEGQKPGFQNKEARLFVFGYLLIFMPWN